MKKPVGYTFNPFEGLKPVRVEVGCICDRCGAQWRETLEVIAMAGKLHYDCCSECSEPDGSPRIQESQNKMDS